MLNRVLAIVLLLGAPGIASAQGPLLWDLQEDFAGGRDDARALTLSGQVAIVVGNGGHPVEGTDENDLVVQAVRRTTGAVNWTDQTFLAEGVIQGVLVASRQHRAYAVGTLREPDDPRSAILVRAYDVPTGVLLWQNIWHPSNQVDADHPTAIIATATQVVVAGYSANMTHDGAASVIRAYDPLTGAVLWEHRDEQSGMDVIPRAVIANQRRVVVAGSMASGTSVSNRDLFVREYNAASGALEWEMDRQFATPTTIALAAGRVVIAGETSSTATIQKSYLAALSAKNGSLLWEDTASINGGFTDIAVNDGRIVGAINNFPVPTVRAYDLLTGNLEWETQPTVPTGMFGSFFTIGQTSDAVFVAGGIGVAFGPEDFWVQAYDAASGTLLWDDRSHAGTEAVATALAVGNSRVLVAGFTASGSNYDWVIRAYDRRVDQFRMVP